jgi:hypothetical protein
VQGLVEDRDSRGSLLISKFCELRVRGNPRFADAELVDMVMPMLAVNQRGAAGKSCELPWSAAVANLQCWFSDQTICSN